MRYVVGVLAVIVAGVLTGAFKFFWELAAKIVRG